MNKILLLTRVLVSIVDKKSLGAKSE